MSGFKLACTLMVFLFLSCTSLNIWASEQESSVKRVIYITLDGVRWQDFYENKSNFPKFWEKYAKHVVLYGDPKGSKPMNVASTPISLPSYQSQMSGHVMPCSDNECGRITVETLPEKLVRSLHISAKEVASFSSWSKIGLSVEHIKGTTYTNIGNQSALDPETKKPDSMMLEINQKQKIDHPIGNDRFDKYTFAQGLHYFIRYNPRFLWLSFDDADEAAHTNDKVSYRRALAFYDDMIDTLFMTLQAMMIDKNTMVVVTTDHGRGKGENWTEHGPKFIESKKTWGFVFNGVLLPNLQKGKQNEYSTLSIRPTIEKALGILEQN